MTIQLKLFALARDLAGSDTLDVELPDGATVADLRTRLVELFPKLGPLLAKAAIAVNAEYAADTIVLTADSDVACIPPVSGG